MEAASNLRVGLAGGRGLRWAMADLTGALREARDRLDLSPISAAALGRALASAVLLLRMETKVPTRVVVEVRGDGPLGAVVAEADDSGAVRGLVGERALDLPATPEGKLDVAAAVGRKGYLRVTYERGRRSYQSQVELVSGEIGEDLAHYLRQSQQVRSAVLLGVLTRREGIAAAGGLVVEVLPGASNEALERVERNIRDMPGVSRLLETGGMAEVLARIFDGVGWEHLEAVDFSYRCRCSRERLRDHLILLSADDREELDLDRGTTEAECVFCGAVYTYRAEELAPN